MYGQLVTVYLFFNYVTARKDTGRRFLNRIMSYNHTADEYMAVYEDCRFVCKNGYHPCESTASDLERQWDAYYRDIFELCTPHKDGIAMDNIAYQPLADYVTWVGNGTNHVFNFLSKSIHAGTYEKYTRVCHAKLNPRRGMYRLKEIPGTKLFHVVGIYTYHNGNPWLYGLPWSTASEKDFSDAVPPNHWWMHELFKDYD